MTSSKSMEYNFLGRSGIRVSKLCLGGMTFGQVFPLPANGCDEDLSHRILDRFVELGGNFVDTADVYNYGQSEEILGRWMERRQRDNVVVATKVRCDMGTDTNVNNIGLSRRHVTASIDNSLRRLHTDYVDLYQIHWPDEGTTPEETLRTLDDLVRCGKVRYVGINNATGWQLQKLVETGRSLGLNPIVSLQQQYNLLERWSELESFQVCKTEGVGVLPWSPLKGGLLSGKIKRKTKPLEGRMAWVGQDKDTQTNIGEIAPAWSTLDDVTFDVIDVAEKVAQEAGKTTAQVALKWLLQKDVVTSVIMGVTKMTQLEDNMAAVGGWSLTMEQMQRLDDVSKFEAPYPYRMVSRLNKDRKNPFLPGQHVMSKM